MGKDRTTIEISPSIRDRLREFKNDRGQTYDGALNTLLSARGYSEGGSILSESLFTEPEYVHRCQASPSDSVCVYSQPYIAEDPYLYYSKSWEEYTEFIDEFEPLLQYFGLFRDERQQAGSFVVSQNGYNWFGAGIDNFFELCTNQEKRYADLDDIRPNRLENAAYIYHKKDVTVFIRGQPVYSDASTGLQRARLYLLTSGCPTQRNFINLLDQLPMTMSNGHSWDPLVLDGMPRRARSGFRDVPAALADLDPRDGIPMVDSNGRQGYVCDNPYYEAPDLLVDECCGSGGVQDDESHSDGDLEQLVTPFTSMKKIFIKNRGVPPTDETTYKYEQVRFGNLPKSWGVTADISVTFS